MNTEVDYLIIKNCLTQTESSFDNHSVTSNEDIVPQCEYSSMSLDSNTDDLDSTKELVEYYIEKFGKGYLLKKTYYEHEPVPYFYGKEFDGGWWNESGGWFFRNHHLDMLLEKGALAPDNSSPKTVHKSNSQIDLDLNEYFINSYGNGYILRCDLESDNLPLPDSQYLFGKDFDGGWWNSSAGGWFFKPKHLDMLIEKGAQLEDVEVSEETNLSDYNIRKHGNGYVLFTDEDVEHTPYFFGKDHYGGWWMPKLDGWFFKHSDLTMLQNLGAELVESKKINKNSLSSLEESSWSKFKGGYLLKPKQNHPNYGQKYLLGNYKYGGWWNDEKCGWFFRPTGWKEYKNKL